MRTDRVAFALKKAKNSGEGRFRYRDAEKGGPPPRCSPGPEKKNAFPRLDETKARTSSRLLFSPRTPQARSNPGRELSGGFDFVRPDLGDLHDTRIPSANAPRRGFPDHSRPESRRGGEKLAGGIVRFVYAFQTSVWTGGERKGSAQKPTTGKGPFAGIACNYWAKPLFSLGKEMVVGAGFEPAKA